MASMVIDSTLKRLNVLTVERVPLATSNLTMVQRCCRHVAAIQNSSSVLARTNGSQQHVKMCDTCFSLSLNGWDDVTQYQHRATPTTPSHRPLKGACPEDLGRSSQPGHMARGSTTVRHGLLAVHPRSLLEAREGAVGRRRRPPACYSGGGEVCSALLCSCLCRLGCRHCPVRFVLAW